MEDMGTNDEELFSMDDLETDLKKSRGARRLPWFAGGLVLGIAGTIFAPGLLAPYLPDSLKGSREILSGPVLGEERDGDRLLLTIETEPGALIASFSERVSEIALLVEPGDIVTIAVDDYDPFIEDPDFEGVKKADPGPAEEMPVDSDDPSTGEDSGDDNPGQPEGETAGDDEGTAGGETSGEGSDESGEGN